MKYYAMMDAVNIPPGETINFAVKGLWVDDITNEQDGGRSLLTPGILAQFMEEGDEIEFIAFDRDPRFTPPNLVVENCELIDGQLNITPRSYNNERLWYGKEKP